MPRMFLDAATPFKRALTHPGITNLPRIVLAPVPLFLVQNTLNRIIDTIFLNNAANFDRLGEHRNKRFLIDPLNLPFIIILRPDPLNPLLKAYRRHQPVEYDARIAGTALTLLDMIDGQSDGDALFFTRDLIVEGNTEAVVCLRNALDDTDIGLADDVSSIYGRPGQSILAFLRQLRRNSFAGDKGD